MIFSPIIVLFKSLRNCKRCNKGNFMLKSNSNKKMLWGGWATLSCKLKDLKRFTFN